MVRGDCGAAALGRRPTDHARLAISLMTNGALSGPPTVTASELEAALADLRRLNHGTAAANMVANNGGAAATLRLRYLRSTGLPPARLWRAYTHYRSTTWVRKRHEVQNPHPEGLDAVLWKVLKLSDKDIGERYMRKLLERN